MHHSEATGDSPGTRKMAHTSVFASRRGSNTGSVGLTASSNSASINCNAIPADDHQSSLIMHHTPPTGSSSPGPLHPPHSLNMHAQPQTLQSAGAQVKKKSGFQITSVLPAQVSASTNNSIADDTESYDDMDESHTEDLSSSDILDVSVSRATDTGIPERSSSEETLNSLHGGETPGVTSPNEPVMHHSQSTQQGYMVNGTVHHHGHHHHSHQPHGHHKDQGIPTAAAQPVQGVAVSPASVASAVSATAGPATSAATVPGRTQKAPSVRGAVEVGAPGILNQPISTVSSSTSGGTGAAGMAGGVVGTPSVGASLPGAAGLTAVTITGIAVAPVQLPPASSSGQTQAAAASTATASRFRVVKLDSSSEPFKKGRWMCTEYYEKESLAAAPCSEAPAPHRAVESVIQSESESTSGSSSSSMMSTDQGTQQVFAPITAPGPHPGLPQTMTQLHALAQDPGAHSVAPGNPQLVSVTGLLGTEGQPPVVRPQQQVPYTLEGQAGQVHSSYALNQKPSVLGNQGLQSMDYAPISQGMQAQPQPHQMPQLQGSVAPRVTPVPTQISSLSVGNPVAVSQAVSSRPQVSAPQMVLTQGHTLSQALQHPSQKPTDQQQTALSQPPLPSSSTPGQTAASILSSTLKNSLQPGLPQTLQQSSAVAAQSGGLGLALRHQGGQSSQLAQPGGPYGGMPPLTASQLEDAGRLLFQHQSLLSLPRLGAGGVAGLIGQSASEPGAILAQDGSGEAGALATSAATDEDSSSGAGVVAIDNKIEQAMDLVKSHLMYAVREEVEVLKEQIKELIERNSQLEQENSLLKTLASPEQLAQFQAQVQTSSPTSSTQPGAPGVPAVPLQGLAPSQGMGPPV